MEISDEEKRNRFRFTKHTHFFLYVLASILPTRAIARLFGRLLRI